MRRVVGRGLGRRANGNNLGLLMREPLPTPTLPSQRPRPPTALTSDGGEGGHLGGRVGEGWGVGAAKSPKPLPPLVLLAVFSPPAYGGARQLLEAGMGAFLGGFGL